jgi:hypothetical protein
VSIAIAVLTIVIDIVEIVLIARQNMPPALYLSFACVKTLIWLVVFILELITLAIAGIILSAIVLYVFSSSSHLFSSLFPPDISFLPLPSGHSK